MNKPHFIKVRKFFININDISSITALRPFDFSSNVKIRDVNGIRGAVGSEITDKYFEWYSRQGGGYHYIHKQEGEKDIFVYEVFFADERSSVYISPVNFEKLSKFLEISDIN